MVSIRYTLTFFIFCHSKGVQNEDDAMIENMWSENTTKLTNAVR